MPLAIYQSPKPTNFIEKNVEENKNSAANNTTPTTPTFADHTLGSVDKIAHGDPSAKKTPSEVKDMAIVIKKYCSETDSVFPTRWKIWQVDVLNNPDNPNQNFKYWRFQ